MRADKIMNMGGTVNFRIIVFEGKRRHYIKVSVNLSHAAWGPSRYKIKKNSESNPWSNGMRWAYGDSGERDILSRRKREGRGGTETPSS
jgi:hypothetical protein